MKNKWVLLFVLALMLVGFGADFIQETYAEPSKEITGSTFTGCPMLLGGYSVTSGENGVQPMDNGGGPGGEDPGPVLRVVPAEDFIYGQYWDVNAEIEVTVDDVEYYTESNDWGYFYLRGGEFSVEAGQLVTVFDGETTKDHTVTDLELTEVDGNTVRGTAEANTDLVVFVNDWFQHIELDVEADGVGDWEVDLMDEEGYDIHDGTFVGAAQEDEDSDGTYAFKPPAPYFNVYPRYGIVWGMYWSVKDTISVKILDEDNQEVASFYASSNEWGHFNTWDQVKEIKPGYTR